MQRVDVKKSTYLDSFKLVEVAGKAKHLKGINNFITAAGTDNNLLLMKEAGFDTAGLSGLSAHDLIIAIDSDDKSTSDEALGLVSAAIEEARNARFTKPDAPHSLDGALGQYPDINLVLISVPGQFAAYEAQRAIACGRHAMIVGGNVPVEDEKRLKTLAAEQGLLFMGPDCGTAIINGVGLGFTNNVPRGNIGIVAASGTGAQEVTSILGRHRVGVSQVIGTGARDLTHVIGGRMTINSLRALIADDDTRVIVLISKAADEEVAEQILREAKLSWKWCIVYFPGWPRHGREDNLIFAKSLTHAAFEASRAAGQEFEPVLPFADEIKRTLAQYKAGLSLRRRYLRGLFCGGTLAQEAIFILAPTLESLRANMEIPGIPLLENTWRAQGHTIIDLGHDTFVRGRAHPLVDQSTRLMLLKRHVNDPETAVVLQDIVLGNGCNPDPGAEVARALMEAYDEGNAKPGCPIVIASICGTHKDPQDYFRQREVLESAGVVVADTNAGACELVLEVLKGR
jgi:succinyl-CoA synthetase alpha subunit